jgi:translation initiation factor IF-3
VVGHDGQQLGVYTLADAINLARSHGVDLVEVAPNAQPPVCRVVDFGKYRYEQDKKKKESKKHQHANKVKEVQLSPKIELHDFTVKLAHAVDFLCEEMKVKVVLKFRGPANSPLSVTRTTPPKWSDAASPSCSVPCPATNGRKTPGENTAAAPT